ncbi:MAG: hypothetical protein ACK4ND_18680 [Cytophagaceae bacterium]
MRGGLYWRFYQGALVPAPAMPCFIKLTNEEAKTLLKTSGAWFIRYASDPCSHETEWYYIICDQYDPSSYSAKIRRNINRGNRNSYVRQIDAEWLAKYGYECYVSAYARYKHASPMSRDQFIKSIISTIEGPFEYWGVFVNDHLAGYCQCIIEDCHVSTNVTKLSPEYLRYRTSYALITTMIKHYVEERNMCLSNGTRSIAHDTNFQEFLVKLGFRKQFCHLNVIYNPLLNFAIKTLFPLRRVLSLLTNSSIAHKLQALLYQEELRRACAQ